MDIPKIYTQDDVAPPSLTPGYRTTEFWLTLLAKVIAGLVALGLITSTTADAVWKAIGATISAVAAVAAAIMYVRSRTSLKSQ
jgi:hypothetical protein